MLFGVHRRDIVQQGCFAAFAGCSIILSTSSFASSSASAVQGAAEYDLEFYMRDLFKGNNREGNLPASSLPPSPPSRLLGDDQSEFLLSLLNENCDGSCIAVDELSNVTTVSSNEISIRIQSIREKVSKAFYVKSPWTRTSITDEYYFDLTVYSLFRVATDLIPLDYKLRDRWIRNIGKRMYSEAKRMGLIRVSTSSPSKSSSPLTSSISILLQVLDLFQSTRYIESYRLGEKNNSKQNPKSTVSTPCFDSFDDDDIMSGRSVNLLLSLFRPATLGSSLQLTAEGSRFSPEFISPVLAAMWEEEAQLYTEYETYFVDNTYRPNPKDFFPDEVLVQFTIQRIPV